MTTIKRPLKYYNTDEYMTPPTNFCPGCGLALALRYTLKVMGDKIVIVATAGCTLPGAAFSMVHNGEPIDSIGSPFGNIAMFAGGISSALRAQGDDETVVIGWGGDGATFDIGFGSISASAERNEDILFICVDNEGYQNTGNQRSSASPWMSTNSTNPTGAPKMEFKKDIDAILSDHWVPYVAAASIGYPDDLMAKIEKAKSLKGFRFVHIYIPCPSGWGCRADQTIDIARLAVDTKVFPIFEVEQGNKLIISIQPKNIPLSEYTKLQRRFRDISEKEMRMFEQAVEERWQRIQFLASY